MRSITFAVVMAASVAASAQQPPGAAHPGETRPPPPAPVVPPSAAGPSNAQLLELLRAQTAAIKALSSKLDTLDARIGTIERGAH